MRNRLTAILILVSLALPAVCLPAGLLVRTASRAVASATDHSCCPRVHLRNKIFVAATLPLSPMPCGNEHLCCMKPGPANAPLLPMAHRIPQPDSKSYATADDHSRIVRSSAIVAIPAVHPFSVIQSTVLRI